MFIATPITSLEAPEGFFQELSGLIAGSAWPGSGPLHRRQEFALRSGSASNARATLGRAFVVAGRASPNQAVTRLAFLPPTSCLLPPSYPRSSSNTLPATARAAAATKSLDDDFMSMSG